jgi:putative PIN family toxin of toxin-antitoxin system
VKRVVADTNILVSALQFGGKPKQLLDLAVDGQIELAISEAIIAETLRVLRDKFERTADWLTEAERQLRVIARLVEPTEDIKAIDADPSDDRILECAVAAGAEVIVSGDTHLLDLETFRGMPIERVAEFLRALDASSDTGGASVPNGRAHRGPDERD